MKEIELKEHNKDTYEQVKEQISLYGRSIVVQPTGTGKSYIMMKLLRDYREVYKVVIGPSTNVLYELQLKEEWTSDKTICYTYSSLGKLVEKIRTYDIEIGLICLDEIQRAGAPVWGRYVSELLELCPEAVVLGLTATPIRFLDKKRDMVKEMFNGISAGNLTIQQCIEKGILPQATYVVGMLDIRKNIQERINTILKCKGSKEDKEQANKLLKDYEKNWDRDESIVKILSDKIGGFRDKNYKHIVFVPSIQVANEMSSVIRSWFERVYKYNKVNVYTVHSKQKGTTDTMKCFCSVKNTNDIDVLICVNMANEGFHVENTKSITMLRYTNSPNLYLQQIGRGLASGGESPYIFDFIGNVQAISNILDIIENNELKVSNILTDNTFERFKLKSKGLFRTFEDNTESFRNTIRKVDRMVASKWDKHLDDAVCTINSGNSIENNPELYKWFKTEQKKFIDNQLSLEREQKFKSLGNIVYMTPTLKSYDPSIIDELSRFNSNNLNSSKVEKVKYLAFIDKLPKEIEKYLKDNSIELNINEDWFSRKCIEYNKDIFNSFKNTLDKISNFNFYDIDSVEMLEVYESIINDVEELKEKFSIYSGRMDSKEAILYNMMSKYWRIHRSDISSHIEIDDGALKNHKLLIREFKGNIGEDIEILKENVYSIPEGLRARSTNILIQIIKKISNNSILQA